MNNKEVEFKFLISKETKNKILSFLNLNAKKVSENHLIDTYYIPSFKDFEIDGQTMECLRIRETNNKSTLCYKKIHRESNPVYCDEYETIISNKQEFEKILFSLGFTIQMQIDKVRQTYRYKNFQFDFDSVKNLGEIMEVEIENEECINNVFEFLSQYNLSKKDVTYEGIQVLMKKAMSKN